VLHTEFDTTMKKMHVDASDVDVIKLQDCQNGTSMEMWLEARRSCYLMPDTV